MVVRLLGALHGCAVLSQALQALDLSFNAVGPEGTNALAAWLTECLPFAPPPLLTRRTNLRVLGVAGTNVTWPVLLAALEQRELRVESLDVSGNALFDKAFCLLNPFVAGGTRAPPVHRRHEGRPGDGGGRLRLAAAQSQPRGMHHRARRHAHWTVPTERRFEA